jgi:hypothetical protein
MTEQNATNFFIINDLRWNVDPCNQFIPNGVKKQALRDACGILCNWIYPEDPAPAHEQVSGRYRFFMGWNPIEDEYFEADGTFNYPEDPPQYPLMQAKLRDETITIYLHSFIDFYNENTKERFYTRMD